MSEIHTPFENYKLRITPLDVAKGVGGAVLNFFSMHQLASHGDHLFEHPLDEPVAQVVDWPGQPYHYPDSSQLEWPNDAA